MQSIAEIAKTATTAASHAASGAAQLANSALAAVGVTAPTGISSATAGQATLPPDSTAGEVKKIDEEGLAVLTDEGVRHEVLVKINHLAREDARHGLKEVAALDLVTDSGNRGIDFYHPLRYYTVHRPYGIDYIGEIEVEDGKCIHVRCHKAGPSAKPTFHSLDTRPGSEGGAVFKTGEAIPWFDY